MRETDGGVRAEVAGAVGLDKDASAQAPGGRRTLMHQGPFSLSTFRGKESHLALGPLVQAPDSGSQMLVGSRTTGEQSQVQVAGPFPESDILVRGRPGICISSSQEILWWGHQSQSEMLQQ